MIISASYRTDIPTFYGEWFIHRLRAGYCKTVNPYNQRVLRISLLPEDVDGIVFWTKNVGPFLRHLPEVHSRGFPFVVQHTVNAYPRALEHSVVDATKSVENLRRVADMYGPKVCVWRYDTIVCSNLTPRESHVETFADLAQKLQGSTDEVVVSFAHVYHKTRRNMDRVAQEHDFEWSDPTDDWKRKLLGELTAIAASHGICLTLCSQPQFLIPGVPESRCVDAGRLGAIAGRSISAKVKGNRKECGCFEARDIGEYDTCPHGCAYCYAVQNQSLAQQRFREHDSESEFLFSPPPGAVTEVSKARASERTLFDQVRDAGE
jgi:hypothetical protein